EGEGSPRVTRGGERRAAGRGGQRGGTPAGALLDPELGAIAEGDQLPVLTPCRHRERLSPVELPDPSGGRIQDVDPAVPPSEVPVIRGPGRVPRLEIGEVAGDGFHDTGGRIDQIDGVAEDRKGDGGGRVHVGLGQRLRPGSRTGLEPRAGDCEQTQDGEGCRGDAPPLHLGLLSWSQCRPYRRAVAPCLTTLPEGGEFQPGGVAPRRRATILNWPGCRNRRDECGLKPQARKGMWVRIPPRARSENEVSAIIALGKASRHSGGPTRGGILGPRPQRRGR